MVKKMPLLLLEKSQEERNIRRDTAVFLQCLREELSIFAQTITPSLNDLARLLQKQINNI